MLLSPSLAGESVVDFLRLLCLVKDMEGDVLGLELRCGLVIGDFLGLGDYLMKTSSISAIRICYLCFFSSILNSKSSFLLNYST